MSCCSHETHAHHNCGCAHPPFPGFLPPWAVPSSGCSQYVQPICSNPAQYSDAGTLQGATLVIRHVSAVAASMGLTLGDEAAWQAADRTYPWAEPLPSAEYWKQLEATL